MRFLHLGDLHLGKSLGDFDLIGDQKYILDQMLAVIRERTVDTVLIAGDVYDKAIPSEAATNLLDYFLCRLAETGVKTFLISGNHDSDDRLNYGSRLFQDNQIFISSVFRGELEKYTVEDEQGEVDVYLLPFVKASQVRHYFPDAKIDSYDDAVRVIIEHAHLNRQKRNVIVAHQFVAGRSEDPVLAGSESIGTQSVGLVEKISYDCFDPFDYVALGHIHKRTEPLTCGRTVCAWPGCPEGRGFDELGEKGFYAGTIDDTGKVALTFVPFARRRYEILTVDVTGQAPRAAIEAALPTETVQDLYRILLTGETGEGGAQAEALQEALADRFYALEIRDQTRLAEDLWARAAEDSLRGLFLRDLKSRLDSARTEEERQRITMAARFGLAALDHRDLG